MTTFTAGANAFDMTAIDLSDFGGGTVTASSATEIDVTGAGGLVYKLIGTGFGSFDVDGFPTTGTVTGFDIGTGVGSPGAFAGLSMTASDFMGFVHTDDLSGFETSALAGNNKIAGSAGNDVLVGFGGNDIINLAKGGDDTASGGDGVDQFSMAGALTAADTLDGGAGDDRVILSGDYSAGVTLGANTFTSIEYMTLAKGNSYHLVMDDANDAAGDSINVNAKALTASQTLVFDASAETDGAYRISAGAGNDTLIGGAGDDALQGGKGNNTFDLSHGGDDIAVGGTGSDIFLMGAALSRFDKINGAGGNDTVVFDGHYAGNIAIKNTQLQHVETLQFNAGNSYTVKMDLTGSASVPYTIDASRLTSSDSLNYGWTAGHTTAHITGGAGNDMIDAREDSQDVIDLSLGGDDTAFVLGGDTVNFGAAFTANDRVALFGNPAAGAVTINLDGDYSAGTAIDIAQSFAGFTNGVVTLTGGHDYDFTLSDLAAASGFTFNAQLLAGDHLFADASALASNNLGFRVTMSAGSFDITGGADTTILTLGGTVSGNYTGGSGGSQITWSGTDFGAGDTLVGHSATQGDELTLTGAYSGGLTFTSTMLQGFGNLVFTAAHDKVTLSDGTIAAGQTLHVSGTQLTLDDTAETDGTLNAGTNGGSISAGAGHDTLTGGKLADTLSGGGGADTINSGTGADILAYHAVSDSTSTGYDTVNAFNADADRFDMPGTVSAVDATVASGALSTASFDTDLAAAVGSGQLGAHHAVLFTPTTGTLAGDTFLIVDANGTAGYQASGDYVIALGNPTNMNELDASNFT